VDFLQILGPFERADRGLQGKPIGIETLEAEQSP
jgi:hypothetical protein